MPNPNLPEILNTQSNDHLVPIENVAGVLSDNLAHIKKRLTRSWLVLSDVTAAPNETEYNAHFKSIAFAVKHPKISKLTDNAFFLPAFDLASYVLKNHEDKRIRSFAAENLGDMLALADGKPDLGMMRILNVSQMAKDNFKALPDTSRNLATKLLAVTEAQHYLTPDFIDHFNDTVVPPSAEGLRV